MNKTLQTAIALLLLSAVNSTLFAQGTAFTYQGQLQTDGAVANGLYDFRFKLYGDTLGNSPQIGSAFLTNSVAVTGGLFTTTVDFGVGVFTGSNYWLEVDVRTNNPANNLGYTALFPNQSLTPVPYAIFANTAGNLSGPLLASQISGTIVSANFSGTYGRVVNLTNANNNFTGNGANLAGVNAATLNGVNATNFWQTTGNTGTAGGVNYLGTADNQPLELRVLGSRAFRLEPGVATNGAPNVIAGSFINFIPAGVYGSTIGGGGGTNYFGTYFSNSVFSVYSLIGGGLDNQIEANSAYSVIAGGDHNQILSNSQESTIGGGRNNTIQTNSSQATIGGGQRNQVLSSAGASTIGGGSDNQIQNEAYDSIIAGGFENLIQTNSVSGTISGGRNNTIQTNSSYTTISGGQNSQIQSAADNSTIAGGVDNYIEMNSSESTIAGGDFNIIFPGSDHSSIGGGYSNYVQTNSGYSTIGGGGSNLISTNAGYSTISGGYGGQILSGSDHSTVGGGSANIIQASASYSTIAGGHLNQIQTNADNSTIGGGKGNQIQTNSPYSTIAGGDSNLINTGSDHACILGGASNLIDTNSNGATIAGGRVNGVGSNAPNAFVAGGYNNQVNGNCGFAGGSSATVTNANSFVWADGTPTTSTAAKQFMIRATGGTVIYSSTGTGAGVSLAAGSGTWSSLSDRNAKDNFVPVAPRQVLAKVAAMAITQWNYKTEPGVTHIGPMAQDFYADFGVGEDNRHITTVDEEGVALAAIQGLNEKVESDKQKIEELKTENAEFKSRLANLEKLLLVKK